MDWPADKLRVYLLDDGRREEFRQFATQCGIGYITRSNNAHAKAGNLNNALSQTNGEFIAVFDSDHIPTRAFLQMSMGWLVAEPRLALVQTPHHFYSPDPFQRNLAAGTRVPAEGNMFYGLVQDGNDYWNATFFCGSCAVLRRAALAEIGGFAVETVTEDAHTMLKMHRRGWDSAYLKLPLAGGLATERLILHVGQRIRWARGMIQIFRIDNPLTGPGLTLGQRICYIQAMGHFFFALPRIVFLCAPLCYLLGGQSIIAASPLAIISYALPHIFHSVATNSRLQRNWRHSFWSEIYETVLALFLIRVTVATLFRPRRGRFNVTAKGGLLENGYFDLGAVYPNLLLAFFLIAGVFRGLVNMIFFRTEILTFQALLLNTIWATFSLLTVMAALAVGRETRQIRSRARIRAVVPVVIYLPDGRTVNGTTRDMSQGGTSIVAEKPETAANGATVQVEFALGNDPVMVPARVLRWEQRFLQLAFQPSTVQEEARVVQAVFGRADAWTDWANYPVDRPVASLWRVLVSIRGLFRPPDRSPVLARPAGTGTTPATRRVAGAAALLMTFALGANAARAQQPAPVPPMQGGQGGFTVRPQDRNRAPQFQQTPPPAPNLGGNTGATAPTQNSPFLYPANNPAAPTGGIPAPTTQMPGALNTPVGGMENGTGTPSTRRIVLTMRQLGALGPLQLRGASELQGVEFGVRADEVVTQAELNLNGAMSPALIPEFSNVTVTLNEQYVGTIPVNKEHPEFQNLVMPISPVFFQDNNRLNFRFTGRYTIECNDPLSGLLWSTISDTSTLTLTLERLPPQRDLARLPLPFFDNHEKQTLILPFIMPADPASEALQAGAIVSSWFGLQADYRGAQFPVRSDVPPDGNAIVIATPDKHPAGMDLPPINGPTLAVVANPNDPQSSLLVVSGRNNQELVQAATALTVGSRALGGGVAQVSAPNVPPRKPYDAPDWIPTDRPVKFGELVDNADLQGTGYVPGTMRVPFRTAPDLFTWRNRAFPMELRYHAPPGPIVDLAVSRLDVGVNNIYLQSFSLADDPARHGSWLGRLFSFGAQAPAARVDVPFYDVFGQNDLQFFFDTRPLHRGDCVAVPQDLRMSVDPDSTIDLSRAHRIANMPNLAYFVNSGFPFTRMADFSDTAVVLPDQPTAAEISALFNLTGRLASITGYPVVRLTVVRAGQTDAVADKDLILLSTLDHLGKGADLLRNGPYQVSGDRLQLKVGGGLESVTWMFDDQGEQQRRRANATLSTPLSDNAAVMVGAESPLGHSRSIVALLASAPAGLDNIVTTLRDAAKAPLIQGDLAVLSGDQVTSYRVGDTYTVGSTPFWVWPSWYLHNRPLGTVWLLIVGCVLVGLAFFWALRRRAAARVASRPQR